MSYKILLVDDEPNVVRGLRYTLRKEKYEVLCASWAEEALQILASNSIDVIISDEQMPGMYGSVMLAKIRREYPQTIRILLTGQASLEAAVRAINEGDIYRFMQKPCNGLDLVITIRRALQLKEITRKSQYLLKIAKQQSELVKKMQTNHPEVNQYLDEIALTATDDTQMDFDALLKKIDTEISVAAKLLGIQEERISDFASDSNTNSTESSTEENTRPLSKTDPSDGSDLVGKPHGSNSENYIETIAAAEEDPETPVAPQTMPSTIEVDDIKDLKPLMAKSEIHELLDECIELKALSPTVAQVLKITQSPRCSIEQVVKIVKQDHAICLKILKLANSTAYTRGEPVDSIQKAVMRIGLSQIRQTVVNISVVDQFNGEEQNPYIRIMPFWEHSIATGLITADITRSLGGKDAQIDAAFTMGLLHDIGKIVYLEMLGDKYLQVLQVADTLKMPLEQVESRLLLVNHADAMDRILHKWKFSKELVNPIALHQLSLGNIRRMAPRTLNEGAALALANRLAHALLLGTSGNSTLYPTEEFAVMLKIKPEWIRNIEDVIPSQTDDVKFSMLSVSNQASWPRLCDEVSEQFQQPFRPLFISEDPEIDSLRIFCDRLRIKTDDELPNLAVIHIKSGRERLSITSKLKKAEKELGCEPLSLLIISPKGDIQLEENAMPGRKFESLSFPVAVSKIIDAVNALSKN
jgi:HD-like signal output (HDOD) protein/DNA-binding response OmpR family regulator